MFTITDAMLAYDEIQKRPSGTVFHLELFEFAGGAAGTAALTRADEFSHWIYTGPLKLPESTHAKDLALHRPYTPANLRALAKLVERELRGKARSVLENPRAINNAVLFDAELRFVTPFFTICQLRHANTLQLHAGPFHLDVTPLDVQSLCDPDRTARRETLRAILAANSESILLVDEILGAGGSNDTYNLDQLRSAAESKPILFNEEEERYEWI